MSDSPAYVANIHIDRIKGPHRKAYLPETEHAVDFGAHSAIAAHYGVDTNVHNPYATTIDYMIAATGG